MEDVLIFESIFLVITLILLRFFYLIHKITTGCSKKAPTKRVKPVKTVICVGSGGHTKEMMVLLSSLDFKKYSSRNYILAKSDCNSKQSVYNLEKTREGYGTFIITEIPRSRAVGQSYITSIVTTIYSIIYSIPIMCKIRPDLILCNGPGTCIPICFIAFILKAAFICDTRIIFIESFCRTESLSLSGKIARFLADNFLVQWPNLRKKLKRADYLGQLM